jgi:hypothetical protein
LKEYTIQLLKSNFFCHITSEVPDQGLNPEHSDRGCDNVLSEQDYRAPQGAAIDEYSACLARKL